jgi:hypothetical protein
MALERIQVFMQQTSTHLVAAAEDACQQAFGMDIATLAEQIHRIALEIFVAVISTILFLANSSIFTIGALYGIVNSENMARMLESIQDVWERQEFASRALIAIACAIAWPIAIATAAFFVGGNVGCKLYGQADRNRIEPSAFDPPPLDAANAL